MSPGIRLGFHLPRSNLKFVKKKVCEICKKKVSSKIHLNVANTLTQVYVALYYCTDQFRIYQLVATTTFPLRRFSVANDFVYIKVNLRCF